MYEIVARLKNTGGRIVGYNLREVSTGKVFHVEVTKALSLKDSICNARLTTNGYIANKGSTIKTVVLTLG